MPIDDQLDALFARIDLWLVLAGEESIDKVKQELEEVNVFDTHLDVIVGYLMCTFSSRKQLHLAWSNFWFRAQQRFAEAEGLEPSAENIGLFIR